ncbi:hypothetical protein ACROYT_G010058 [Oculina patagonica]
MSGSSFLPLKTPSLESLIRASSTVENPELRLSGLAVFSNLSDACQPPVDVSKSNIHVNKIALITVIANKAECSLQDLTMQTEVVVEISVSQKTDDLKRMQKYLERLYYWFLLGPLITLEWLRRTKKFCCMSGGQRVHEDERSTEDEETVDETSLHAVVVETQEQFDQETEHEQSTGEEQPLIIAVNDPRANRTTMGHTGCLAKRLSWHFSQNCCWLWLRDSHRSSSPGVVVPYCSLDNVSDPDLMLTKFIYFTTYNSICTICNMLFIIILNKHKFVTRYVFYISVCMICAYVESDIVAVFYFMLNSEGSLINLKLTALRTVAIGFTLTLSLSSSMHIIRKLNKPQESLFEGLSEK